MKMAAARVSGSGNRRGRSYPSCACRLTQRQGVAERHLPWGQRKALAPLCHGVDLPLQPPRDVFGNSGDKGEAPSFRSSRREAIDYRKRLLGDELTPTTGDRGLLRNEPN